MISVSYSNVIYKSSLISNLIVKFLSISNIFSVDIYMLWVSVKPLSKLFVID